MSAFQATPQEQELVLAVFSRVGALDETDVICWTDAMSVFAGANLSDAMLRSIWCCAGPRHYNYLTRRGVGIFLRLVGWIQSGEEITADLIARAGPLALIEGLSGQRIPPKFLRSSLNITSSSTETLTLECWPLMTSTYTRTSKTSISRRISVEAQRSGITQSWKLSYLSLEQADEEPSTPISPSSVRQLTQRSQANGFHVDKPISELMYISKCERYAGEFAQAKGDIEDAFIHFSRSTSLVLNDLPTHPSYEELSDGEKQNITEGVQSTIDLLHSAQSYVNKRFADWRTRYIRSVTTISDISSRDLAMFAGGVGANIADAVPSYTSLDDESSRSQAGSSYDTERFRESMEHAVNPFEAEPSASETGKQVLENETRPTYLEDSRSHEVPLALSPGCQDTSSTVRSCRPEDTTPAPQIMAVVPAREEQRCALKCSKVTRAVQTDSIVQEDIDQAQADQIKRHYGVARKQLEAARKQLQAVQETLLALGLPN